MEDKYRRGYGSTPSNEFSEIENQIDLTEVNN
jgi:hypothetical protein